MISEKDKLTIISIARRFKVKRVLLFGSNISSGDQESRDIDLAVEGVPSRDFFKFYGELLFRLNKPVDLIDLSFNNKFNRLVRQEGIAIYG
jgi:predicted nucleotidyltransferase